MGDVKKCLVNCRVPCPENRVLCGVVPQKGVVLEKAGDPSLRFLICKMGVPVNNSKTVIFIIY